MKFNIIYIIAVLPLCISCVKPAPQLPSNKGNELDSTAINLKILNEVMIRKEDSLIQDFVNKQKVPFIKNENGVWYHKAIETTNDSLINDTCVQFYYKCYTFSSDFIVSEKISVNIGKKEIPVGLEDGIKMMRKGEKMKLIVPWYLAYGMKGKDNIPPYTSLIYDIRVEQ